MLRTFYDSETPMHSHLFNFQLNLMTRFTVSNQNESKIQPIFTMTSNRRNFELELFFSSLNVNGFIKIKARSKSNDVMDQ